MEERHTISLTLGDWSRDGHNQTDQIIIKSNRTTEQIKKAYKKGVKLVGFDFSEEVASEYEDNRIREEELEKLRTAGYTQELDDEYTKDELGEFADLAGTAALSSDTFAEIYLWIAKRGDPSFEYEVAVDHTCNINIGGYGLFY
jgi:hypothetical protein